jgi:hypothetical protein
LAFGLSESSSLLIFCAKESLTTAGNKIRDSSTEGRMKYQEIKKASAEVVNVRLVKKMSTSKAHAAIRDVIVQNPATSYSQIAELLECSRWLVYTVAVEFNVKRPRGGGSPARRKEQI